MLTKKRADRLAQQLDLDVDRTTICLPCLSIVSFALDEDDEPKIRGKLVSLTPILWDEGLALPLQRALERARSQGVPDSGAALADLARAGPRTTIARAAVRLLALQLSLRSRSALN